MGVRLLGDSADESVPSAAAALNRGPSAMSSHAALSALPEVDLSWSKAAYPCSHRQHSAHVWPASRAAYAPTSNFLIPLPTNALSL